MKLMKFTVNLLFVMLCIYSIPQNVYSEDNPNTIIFDNKSGEPALVKVIGPSGQIVEVPNGQSHTVNAAAGEYYILVRYGSKPKDYKYTKGDKFDVTQTSTQYSVITITLHKVIGGNYTTYLISSEEFEKTPVPVAAKKAKQREDVKMPEPLKVVEPLEIKTFKADIPKIITVKAEPEGDKDKKALVGSKELRFKRIDEKTILIVKGFPYLDDVILPEEMVIPIHGVVVFRIKPALFF